MPWVAIAGLALSAIATRSKVRSDQKTVNQNKRVAEAQVKALDAQRHADALASNRGGIMPTATTGDTTQPTQAAISGTQLAIVGGLGVVALVSLMRKGG